MSGGPSQLETFDPKPEHDNGGPTEAISTSIPGISISQHSAAGRSGDAASGSCAFHVDKGRRPFSGDVFPAYRLPASGARALSNRAGSMLGRQLRDPACDLPAYVSINPFQAFSPAAFSPGFLGPAWSPLRVESQTSGDEAGRQVTFDVRNLKTSDRISSAQADARLQLLASLEHDFLAQRPDGPGVSHVQAYQQAVRMMKSAAVSAFDLEREDAALRDAYGRNPFGQGCLLARRLLESGVSFVEVNLSGPDGSGNAAGWDTHQENFTAVANLCGVLDPAWATLMNDLQQRGLLQETLVVWMGEFGRTPIINQNSGRDHWPQSWTAVLGGAGIRGGQVYGQTSADGTMIEHNPVTVPSFMATICKALRLDPETTNISNVGRPIPLADHGAEPIAELLT
jgi:hypothetical protein